MAVIPIISQSWDTSSYVNPTRMNNIETNIGIVSKATGVEYSSGVSVKDKLDDTLVEDIANLISWNGTYNIWATNTGALSRSGYNLVGVQVIATNTNSPTVPAISYQGNTLRIRGWDGNYTFIAMGVWKKA